MLNQSINIALVQQVANLHVVIDLSVVNLLATQKSCEQVANWLETSCQPGLATSFQLHCVSKKGPTLKRYSSKLYGSILMIFSGNIQKSLE